MVMQRWLDRESLGDNALPNSSANDASARVPIWLVFTGMLTKQKNTWLNFGANTESGATQ